MDDAAIAPARHRLSVDAYHRMADADIFGKDDRIELVDGDLIDMVPIGRTRRRCGQAGRGVLHGSAGRAIVSAQNPVRLDHSSEPQPDVAVLRRRAELLRDGGQPGLADILLLVEVADSSIRYRQHGEARRSTPGPASPKYWIVDMQRRIVGAYRGPVGDGYAGKDTHKPGDQVALVLAPDIVVRLDVLFG